MMLTKPIEHIPNILIYKVPNPPKITKYAYSKSGQPALYKMADTRTGQYVGEMMGGVVLHNNKHVKHTFYPNVDNYKSFYIAELNIKEMFCGYGRKFIEFAKNLSRQSGANGRVHLVASRIYCRYYPPHVFYKKCGFISNNNFMNSYLDDCVKEKLQIENVFADNLDMFMPLENETYNYQTKFQKLINFLKRFI